MFDKILTQLYSVQRQGEKSYNPRLSVLCCIFVASYHISHKSAANEQMQEVNRLLGDKK